MQKNLKTLSIVVDILNKKGIGYKLQIFDDFCGDGETIYLAINAGMYKIISCRITIDCCIHLFIKDYFNDDFVDKVPFILKNETLFADAIIALINFINDYKTNNCLSYEDVVKQVLEKYTK